MSWLAASASLLVLLSGPRSIRDFEVHPGNSAATNTRNLQLAIDWASPRGAALWVDPEEGAIPLDSGVILRANASLIGPHGPVGRGTRHPDRPEPVGAVFKIMDRSRPVFTVESSTKMEGIQFWYPEQTISDPKKLINYPPTIQVSQTKSVFGVTLRDLTFYGETMAMDFAAKPVNPCEQILIEHCYGYPLSGQFVRIDYCYDIPRILNCHVNPANLRTFRGDFSKEVIDSVVAKKTYAYWIDHTDNAQLVGVFTFGTFGGAYLGPATYGQMTNFNFDCVTIGVRKEGDSDFNRNWMLSNGSIIANTGDDPTAIHPFWMSGKGHLGLSNVEAFSGPNGALTTVGSFQDFLLVDGKGRATVAASGCRMRGYRAAQPVTFRNPEAIVRLTGCFDKDLRLYERMLGKP